MLRKMPNGAYLDPTQVLNICTVPGDSYPGVQSNIKIMFRNGATIQYRLTPDHGLLEWHDAINGTETTPYRG